jgi:hypothetical protein
MKGEAMKKLMILASLVFLGGCGSKGGGNDSPTSSDKGVVAAKSVSSKSDDVAIDPNEPYYGARLIEAAADMGDCDAAQYRELVYVLETQTFYYCAQSNKWLSINLQGPKGEAGSQGVQGVQGVQGIAGKDGGNGKDGTNGKDGVNGKDASSLVWVHPVNGSRWFLGSWLSAVDIASTDKILCPSGSVSPTSAQYLDAIQSGIGNQFNATMHAGIPVGAPFDFGYSIGRGLGTGAFPYNILAGDYLTGATNNWIYNDVNINNRYLLSICISN